MQVTDFKFLPKCLFLSALQSWNAGFLFSSARVSVTILSDKFSGYQILSLVFLIQKEVQYEKIPTLSTNTRLA